MKKCVHNITMKVFEKETDQIQKCLSVFKHMIPVDFEKEKIPIHHEKADGFFQKTIHILKIKTEKNRHNMVMLNTVFSHLSADDRKRVTREILTRIDDDGFFYIRLDKESLFQKKYRITESGDCFHMKIKLAAFPASTDAYLKAATQLLSMFGSKDQTYKKET